MVDLVLFIAFVFFRLFINIIFIPFTLYSNASFSGGYSFSVHLGRFIVLPFSHHSRLQIVSPEGSTHLGEPRETLSRDVWVCTSRHTSELGDTQHGALRKFSHKAWGRGCTQRTAQRDCPCPRPVTGKGDIPGILSQSSLSPQPPGSLIFYIPTYCEGMHVHTCTQRLHMQSIHDPCISHITHSTYILHIHTAYMSTPIHNPMPKPNTHVLHHSLHTTHYTHTIHTSIHIQNIHTHCSHKIHKYTNE